MHFTFFVVVFTAMVVVEGLRKIHTLKRIVLITTLAKPAVKPILGLARPRSSDKEMKDLGNPFIPMKACLVDTIPLGPYFEVVILLERRQMHKMQLPPVQATNAPKHKPSAPAPQVPHKQPPPQVIEIFIFLSVFKFFWWHFCFFKLTFLNLSSKTTKRSAHTRRKMCIQLKRCIQMDHRQKLADSGTRTSRHIQMMELPTAREMVNKFIKIKQHLNLMNLIFNSCRLSQEKRETRS